MTPDGEVAAVDRFLGTASVAVVGSLLAEIETSPEFDGWFFCPRCQRSTSQQLQHAPAAKAVDLVRWRCTRGPHSGERWGLGRVVKARETAYRRLLEVLRFEESSHG